jgi:hypothetical protein
MTISRRVPQAALAFLLAFAGTAGGQTVRGLVVGPDRNPLAGAEILFGGRSVVTGDQGSFRVDGVPIGEYQLTVRMIGYRPFRGRLTVGTVNPDHVITLSPDPALSLPPIIVEGRRVGLYGLVADSSFRPAPGARVRLIGPGGGDTRTDSAGRFAFPHSGGGEYLVRVSLAAHQERRFSVTLEADRGREVTIRLPRADPDYREARGRELWALEDLGRRLRRKPPGNIMTREELSRYGTMSLCAIPQIKPMVGTRAWGYLDGWHSYFNACRWRADQAELVEWGSGYITMWQRR